MRRQLSIFGLVLGVLLVAAAGVIRWVVAPSAAVLPGDTNTTRTYAGTAAVLLNAQALSSGSSANVMLRNVPIAVVHQVKVLKSSGDNALVSDVRTVRAGTTPVASLGYKYAVDRTSMARGSGYSGVIAQTGQTFSWPIRTAKHDYTGWVPESRTTTQLAYVGTATRGGITTYVFRATVPGVRVTDPEMLKGLPAALPKATLLTLARGLNLPAAQLAGLTKLAPQLPSTVPFSYSYATSVTYWVAPTSGIVVDLQQREVITAGLKVGAVSVPVTPVLDISFTSTPATLKAAVNDAKDKGNGITLVYTTMPLGLLIGGAVIALVGATGLVAGRKPPQPPVPVVPRELTPTA
jgi:hypothetical protein